MAATAWRTPDLVRSTTQTLTRVVGETTGRRADIGRPQAGKTGTADDETFAWFVGYTPDLALAVQVSDPLRDPEAIAAGVDPPADARRRGVLHACRAARSRP